LHVSNGFSKNTQTSNLIKICPVEAEFFFQMDRETDGRTDKHDETVSGFMQF